MRLTINKSINEERLISGCRKNDSAAQGDLYQKYSPILFGICLRYVKDTAEAEDILIQGFMKIFQKIDQYKGEGSFEGWMRRIVVNESLTYLRKNKSMHLKVDMEYVENKTEASTYDVTLYTEDLLKMVQQLPIGYRTVFNLYAIEGFSHKEIAQKLNISENTSKSQLSRARKLLQSYLNDENEIKSASNE